VVDLLDVKLGEGLGSSRPLQDFANEGSWMSILFGDFVECSIVGILAEFALFFLDEHDWCGSS